jgi:hypothetical protein
MATSPHICCPDSCLILFDDFNRSAVGCLWDDRQGNWSINTNRLRESGNSGALIIAQRQVPELSFSVSVETPSVPENAKYRVIVNYVDDDNYHFAEFEFLSNTLKIRLYKRSGGSNSLLLERSWNDVNVIDMEESFGVCLSEKIFWASQKYDPYQVWITNPTLHSGGYRAGLGNGAGIQIEYDNFYLEETGDTRSGCVKCSCRCNDVPLPMNLTAHCTFSGGFAACDPVSVPLQAITPGSPEFSQGEWYGSATVDCSDCPGPLESFDVYVRFQCGACTENASRQYQVWASGYSGSGTACEVPEGVTCDPLSIPFETIVGFLNEGGACSEQSGDRVDLDIEITD